MSTNPYQAPATGTASSPTRVRHEVLGLLTLAAAIAYLARNAVSVAESTIREDLGLTIRQSGWFMAAFFWSYAALQVPGGSLAHRRGTRFAMVVFACGWSVASVCIGMAPGLWLLVAAQLLMGAAQAGIFPASCYSISHWTPLARRTLACGVLAMGMQVGAIIASMLTGPLMDVIHWRWVFALFAVPGFAWAAGFLLRFRNYPTEDENVNEAELAVIQSDRLPGDTPSIDFRSDSMEVDCSKPGDLVPVWPTDLSRRRLHVFCQLVPDISAGDSWSFRGRFRISPGVGLCGNAGRIALRRITHRLDLATHGKPETQPQRSGGNIHVGLCRVDSGGMVCESTLLAVVLLSFGSLLAALAGPCASSATIDIGGDHVPQVYGIMNMSGNFAAAACPILVAELFEWTSNWTIVLLLFAAIYLVGAICWALVDSRRQISG